MKESKILKYIEIRERVRDDYFNTAMNLSQIARKYRISYGKADKMIMEKNEPQYYLNYIAKGGETMKILVNIKAIVAEDVSIEDLFLVKNNLAIIDSGYQDLGLPTPEWIVDKMGEVTMEITNRVRAELTRRLRAAEARDAALKPKSEVRKDVQSEIASLKKLLGN